MKGKESRDFEEVGPKFELVASANLTLDHCSEGNKGQVFDSRPEVLKPTQKESQGF